MPEEFVNFIIFLDLCWALNLSYHHPSLELSREVFKRRGKGAPVETVTPEGGEHGRMDLSPGIREAGPRFKAHAAH